MHRLLEFTGLESERLFVEWVSASEGKKFADVVTRFTDQIHSYGLKSALAGSVKEDQLKILHELGCDVVGIRGAACTGGDRNQGSIHHSAVSRLKSLVSDF